jgi:hypothetical protein
LLEFFRRVPSSAEALQAQVALQFQRFLTSSETGRHIEGLFQAVLF